MLDYQAVIKSDTATSLLATSLLNVSIFEYNTDRIEQISNITSMSILIKFDVKYSIFWILIVNFVRQKPQIPIEVKIFTTSSICQFKLSSTAKIQSAQAESIIFEKNIKR